MDDDGPFSVVSVLPATRHTRCVHNCYGSCPVLKLLPLCPPPHSPHKGQVKAKRQLEVQLNGCTLVVPSDGIFDFNINLQQHTKKRQTFLELLGPSGLPPGRTYEEKV